MLLRQMTLCWRIKQGPANPVVHTGTNNGQFADQSHLDLPESERLDYDT